MKKVIYILLLLFKFKKGKSEKYIKDEQALIEFLTHEGFSKISVHDADNNEIVKEKILNLFVAQRRLDNLLKRASVKEKQ